MVQTEDIMSTVKNMISVSIRKNTIRGYIGWSSCDNICMDIHDCLDMCEKKFEEKEYLAVLQAAEYILVSGAKLASNADSSSGMLTDVIMCTYELIEKCTKEIAKQEKEMREEALNVIMREAKKKAFDGWDNWRYDLLKCGICLCDEKGAKKLEKVMDTLLNNYEKDSYFHYIKEDDLIVRYLLHRHLRGKEATRKELYENIKVKQFRLIAIEDAMQENDYKEAERLCIGRAKTEESYYQRNNPEDWNNLLFHIYETAGNKNKMIKQAKKLLLLGNEDYWDILKDIYKQDGVWEKKQKELLDELKDSKRSVCYRAVLIKEDEKERLLDDVENNPYDLFYYGEFLVKDYPEQIYEICYNVIWDNCAQAKDRREYKKVAKQILQLIKWNGKEKSKELVARLKETYPRRPALLDELGKVEKKL